MTAHAGAVVDTMPGLMAVAAGGIFAMNDLQGTRFGRLFLEEKPDGEKDQADDQDDVDRFVHGSHRQP